MNTDDRVTTASTLDRQVQNGAGYTDEERKTLKAAADILRKKISRGGPKDAGGPVDELKTR